MWFRRNRPSPEPGTVGASPTGAVTESPDAVRSPGLAKVLDRVFRGERVRVLDLGPTFGTSIIELAGRGAAVAVDDFAPPPVPPAPGAADESDPPPPWSLDHPDASFDLVLLWERLDYVPPQRLREFGQEIRRVLKVGGWLLSLTSSRKEPERSSPARIRILDDGHVLREPSDEPERPRWAHPNREIERAFDGLSIQGVHLQRDGTREIVACKGPRR